MPRPVFALWQRLDRPGHDACLLVPRGAGWLLEGTAVFAGRRGPAMLAYAVLVDARWRTRSARVDGFVAARRVACRIARTRAGWTLDGRPAPAVAACLDVDFGFTPATNVLLLRRLALRTGATAAVDVAWWDVGVRTLVRLPQTYDRCDARRYRYESPTVGYRATLAVGRDGFAERYPGLWRAQAVIRT
jgi:hypothetical protein